MTVAAGTFVELTIARIVVQEITTRGTVGSSRPPVPAPGIVEGATIVIAAGDCRKSSKTGSGVLEVRRSIAK